MSVIPVLRQRGLANAVRPRTMHSSVRDPRGPPDASRSNFARRLAFGVGFTGLGLVMAASPAFRTAREYLDIPSDQDTLVTFAPSDATTAKIESTLQAHPMVAHLRKQSELVETRPHLKIPVSHRRHHLTGGVLMGTGRVVVPPLMWFEKGGKSVVSIAYLGQDLCGHPNVVHGGMLATILDEGLASCCFGALPSGIAMTANLNINYRAPAKANAFIVLRARTVKVEGRKAWVEGRLETLPLDGELPVTIAEASGLFIEPKYASVSLATDVDGSGRDVLARLTKLDVQSMLKVYRSP